MGLYDGMDGTDVGSTAQVARILDIPTLLVINVHGMSRSAAAMEQGFAGFDPQVRLVGTILNQVGSARHLAMLKSCLKKPIFGALPREREMEMKSRHLGLVMGFEKEHDSEYLASFLEENASIDEILKLSAVTLSGSRGEGRSGKIGAHRNSPGRSLLLLLLREPARAGEARRRAGIFQPSARQSA